MLWMSVMYVPIRLIYCKNGEEALTGILTVELLALIRGDTKTGM
jgi:hypothetical protein